MRAHSTTFVSKAVRLCLLLDCIFLSLPQFGLAQEEKVAKPQPAEQERVPRLGHPPSLFTLSAECVQKELALSEDQVARIAELARAYLDETHPKFLRIRELSRLGGALSPEVNGDSLAEVSLALDKDSARYERLALEVLDTKQAARLKQLRLQGRGVWIFFDAPIREHLQVTELQTKRITELVAECESGCQETRRQAQLGKLKPQTAVTNVNKLRAKVRADVRSVLTAEQQEQLDAMLGPKPPYEPTELRVRLTAKSKP